MIKVENVAKSFGPQVVLRDISFEVADGETLTIIGPSGVGKSVLLKLILGIMAADRGQITINGQSMTAAKSERAKNKIREQMGVLFQSSALFDSLSVYKNIAFPLVENSKLSAAEIDAEVRKITERLSLTNYLNRMPQELSIGAKKRIGIARALITKPSIFLFDEPNTGLDPKDGQAVYDLIKECQRIWKFAGLVISHQIPEVFQVSDRVAMLLNGGLIAQGSPEDLTSSEDPAVKQFLAGSVSGPIQLI